MERGGVGTLIFFSDRDLLRLHTSFTPSFEISSSSAFFFFFFKLFFSFFFFLFPFLFWFGAGVCSVFVCVRVYACV